MSKSKKTSSPSKMVSLRLNSDMLNWVDTLVPALSKLKEYRGVLRVDRSAVLRMALQRGLEALEAEHKP